MGWAKSRRDQRIWLAVCLFDRVARTAATRSLIDELHIDDNPAVMFAAKTESHHIVEGTTCLLKPLLQIEPRPTVPLSIGEETFPC